MIENRLLIWRFKCGSQEALTRIYEKYYGYLVSLATALLNDVHAAEDVVHDFFVSFAQSGTKLRVTGNFKSYLATCVANLARDRIRARRRNPKGLDEDDPVDLTVIEPDLLAVRDEEMQQLNRAMAQLPYEQREVIALHLRGKMRFTQIARVRNVSVNTIRSRYRYGLTKLKSLLNSEVMQ